MSAQLAEAPPVRSRGKRWTPDEVATMRALYRDHTAFDVGRAIGRSPEAIRQKAILLGLSQPTAARIRWTPAANARLREGYQRTDTVDLARSLGTTVDAVRKQAQALGLARPTPHRPWTPDKDRILRELYGLVDAGELARRLGYSRAGVYNRLKFLGVNRATAAAARYARDHAEIERLRDRGADDGDSRRLRMLLAASKGMAPMASVARLLGMTQRDVTMAILREAVAGAELVAGSGG